MGGMTQDSSDSDPQIEEGQRRRDDQDEATHDRCLAHAGCKLCENYEETPNHIPTAQCHGRSFLNDQPKGGGQTR